MKTVDKLIKNAEKLLPGIDIYDDKPDERWDAIIKIGDYIETNPKEIWLFIRKWGIHPYESIRAAIATCLLEHLLEYHFKEYFPLVKDACYENKLFATTFMMCWQFGQAKQPENSSAFNELRSRLA